MKFGIRILVSFFIFIFCVCAHFLSVKIGFNVSGSMPTGIYFMTGKLNMNFHSGDAISFCPPYENMNVYASRKYISESKYGICYGKYSPFIKKIIAKKGDEIQVKNNFVYLNGELIHNSFIYENDDDGRTLSHLKNGFTKILSENEYFVFSNLVKHSLDSRYVGIVHKEDILSKVYLIYNYGTK